MQADNTKLMIIYYAENCYYSGVLPHFTKNVVSFIIPPIKLDYIYCRENLLIVKGWSWTDGTISGRKPKALFYHRRLPLLGHSYL
mmetsp:Transcript_22752/g.40924  ORF Transcript_22752/g.40924 Transcript_22752/m.40924 type:complete len:85 (-) Transcript_22752:478-732(-)